MREKRKKEKLGMQLTGIGASFCITSVMGIPVALTADDWTLGERIVMLICFIIMAIGFGMVCRKGIRMSAEKSKESIASAEQPLNSEGQKKQDRKEGSTVQKEIVQIVEDQNEEVSVTAAEPKKEKTVLQPKAEPKKEKTVPQPKVGPKKEKTVPQPKADQNEKIIKKAAKHSVSEITEAEDSAKNKNISQPNPYSRAHRPVEIAGPGRSSQYDEESKNFLFLSEAHLADKLEWGQQEYFAVNTETWQPFYILSQYDGCVAAHTWYEIKEPVTWEEVETYADAKAKYQLGNRNIYKSKRGWKLAAVAESIGNNQYNIKWRIGKERNAEIEIRREETEFFIKWHLGKIQEKRLPLSVAADENAFRSAVRELAIHNEYIMEKLWCFVKSRKILRADFDDYNSVEWKFLYGEAGMHGDLIRVGRKGKKFYLEMTNDGYPNRMAAGGIAYTIPKSVISDDKLKRKEFEKYYREAIPDGPKPENLNYNSCKWFIS